MLGGRDVADGVDVFIAAAQRRIDAHPAVGDGQAGALGQFDIGLGAHGDQHGVGADGGPVAESQSGGGVVCRGDLLDTGVQPQIYSVLAVQLGEDLRGFGTQGEQR